jgi:putative transposase
MSFSRRKTVWILIHPEIEAGLYAYIHGIVENNKSKLIIGNGTANHGHLLISMGKTIDISDLIGNIKRDSSVWMKRHERAFYWQERIWSVLHRRVAGVARHEIYRGTKRTPREERFQGRFRGLLGRYKVEYDERYIWD